MTDRTSLGRAANVAYRTAVIGAIAMLGMSLSSMHSPASAATKAGEAQVVTPDDGTPNGSQPLHQGATATAFSLKLPAGAACQGDSANDGYRVQSYMVPASVDPGTLQYGSVGPTPTAARANFREPLFETTSNPVVNQQTAAATTTPGPGPIVNIPAMNFSVFKPGDAPAGTYNVGVACTKGPAGPGQVDTYWNTQLVVTASLGGKDAAVAWTVAPAEPPSRSTASTSDKAATAAAAVTGADATSSGGTPSSSASGSDVAGTHGARTSRALTPSGAPPSLGVPIAGIASHLCLTGTSRLTLAVWALLLLAAMRVGVLMIRLAPRVSLETP